MRRGPNGRAIRSQAWPGTGGQEGSETSGVSPNNNPRHERPASNPAHVQNGSGELCDPKQAWMRAAREDEIVQASRKREGT
jgi:hypothetical protein